MKRHKFLSILLILILGATAQAQQAPPQREGGAADPATNGDVLSLLRLLPAVQQQASPQPVGQRGAGGRGGPALDNRALNNPDLLNEVGRILAPAPTSVVTNNRGLMVTQNGGAWWTNTALVARLGLTDDQKLKIERAYESHRQNLVTSKELLEKEEAQLSKLLETDPLDRTATIAQIYKAIQARGEMERTNALMTFEMREVLTRAQWMQLQVQQSLSISISPPQGNPFGTPGQGGGGRGGRGAAPGAGATSPLGTVAPAGTGGQRSGRGQ